jgi:para-nitrobenzyl esterase
MDTLDSKLAGNQAADSVPSGARRDALKQGLTLLGSLSVAAAIPVVALAADARTRPDAAASTTATAQGPIVATQHGKVIGYLHKGINAFKGIPYGADAAGANRFKPPRKPVPWVGVRSSRQYGPVSPQAARSGWANDEEAFLFSWNDGVQGEDCLRVNVWTPAVNDDRPRPVMVWLHGGGFAAGSGQELLAYDGENLARSGDVVVVSLNHRLNVFGYLDLSWAGQDYASSANVGMLDIVAALEWVRENIAAFGGDPGNVTIFGQSGGGGKAGTLMAMPGAKGLFHKAIIESGSMAKVGSAETSRKLGEQVVAELGFTQATIGRIHELPSSRLLEAAAAVLRRAAASATAGPPDIRRMADRPGFAPVLDGTVVTSHPFSPVATPLAAGIPLIVGSTLNEFVTGINHPEYEAMTLVELQSRATAMFGARAESIVGIFRKRTPLAKPFDLWSRIAASSVRGAAVDQAKAQAANGNAPVYLYWFTWQTPVLDGRPRAFHCSELPFVFDNTDRCEAMTGGGPEARKLGMAMSQAWTRFARTGNPNHAAMPVWQPVTAKSVPTMIFDSHSTLAIEPDREELASVSPT